MLKKITISQLDTGMYVQELDCGWMTHPFLSSSFKVTSAAIIDKIRKAGIQRLVIDTAKGKDVGDAPTVQESNKQLDQRQQALGEAVAPQENKRSGVANELGTAKKILQDAQSVMHNILAQARADENPRLDDAHLLVERITDSLARNPDALLGISRIKQKDQYLFQHSVATSVVLGAFARAMKLPVDTIRDIVMGGLLHDIGKTQVPLQLLQKPAKLTEDEFAIVAEHVSLGRQILLELNDIPKCVIDIVSQHHERWDGTGYPKNLKGNQISIEGQMAGIVDVYDALTANRPYKSAAEPALALKKILEWSDLHFDAQLVQHFIRAMGIYPVASLVQLDNGLVGVVLEQSTKLLRPCIRVFYDITKKRYVQAHTVDLSAAGTRYTDHKIVGAVNPSEHRINPYDFI
ncbi:MAG: HD-GYP domain-containing protein [Gammaproteobacteria bacterium]|nr:HD-GYP domain-containing protein [Gammaproteobacteria bacterium]